MVSKKSEKNLNKSQNVYDDAILYKTKSYKPKSSLSGIYLMWRKYRYRIFIIMYKTNGTIDLFYAFHSQHKFSYEGGVYIIERDSTRWSDELQSMVSVYFQGVALPINLSFDEKATVNAIKQQLKQTRVEANVDPHVLSATVNSEVIQKLMRGEELEKMLNTILKVGAGTLALVLLLGIFLVMVLT